MQPSLFSLEPQRKTYTVTELNARIRGLLDEHLGEIFVARQISASAWPPADILFHPERRRFAGEMRLLSMSAATSGSSRRSTG